MTFSALIGSPVGHSVGQDIYNRLFKKYGIDSQYLAINLHKENLKGFFDFARKEIIGFNITAPYKEASIGFLDAVDETVSITGSANLVKNINGKLFGYNSDYDGFLLLLRKNDIDLSGKRIVIMGSGGAARTVAYAIIKNYDSSIWIASRTPGREVIRGINTIRYDEISGYDVIINCTPLGTFTDSRMALPPDRIVPGKTGIDIIYNPDKTPFLGAVEKRGGNIINGADMFIGQGMETLKKIYGLSVDYSEFKGILYEKVK
jgi:shikimate dehydrogenase